MSWKQDVMLLSLPLVFAGALAVALRFDEIHKNQEVGVKPAVEQKVSNAVPCPN